jgi:hypothetical protein
VGGGRHRAEFGGWMRRRGRREGCSFLPLSTLFASAPPDDIDRVLWSRGRVLVMGPALVYWGARVSKEMVGGLGRALGGIWFLGGEGRPAPASGGVSEGRGCRSRRSLPRAPLGAKVLRVGINRVLRSTPDSLARSYGLWGRVFEGGRVEGEGERGGGERGGGPRRRRRPPPSAISPSLGRRFPRPNHHPRRTGRALPRLPLDVCVQTCATAR